MIIDLKQFIRAEIAQNTGRDGLISLRKKSNWVTLKIHLKRILMEGICHRNDNARRKFPYLTIYNYLK